VGNFNLAAGIELRSSCEMTLATDWDLHTTRPGGAPGYLTLRAAGNLKLDHSLSDGFDGVTSAANLLSDESWSYRLVSGARVSGADVFALRQSADLAAADTGDVVIGADAIIRTGTGNIDIAAGRSVVLKREGANPELFNPANPSQVISIEDAITADGLALQTIYQRWRRVAGGANYIYNPNDPTGSGDLTPTYGPDGTLTPPGAVDLIRAFRPDGTLYPKFRGWRSISGLDLIYNPANPSERIHFFDAFDSNGVLMPAYRGWKSVSPSGNYSMTFTITDPDGNSMVTDIMNIFQPDGKVDLSQPESRYVIPSFCPLPDRAVSQAR